MSSHDFTKDPFDPQVEYRKLDGYSRYMFGSDGSVYSIAQSKYKYIKLKHSYNNGYPVVTISSDDFKRITVSVHSIIAKLFIGPCPEGMECRHKDGNRKNPRKDNLIYGTRKDNMQDAIRHGTTTRGEKNFNCVLNESIIIYMREEYASGKQDTVELAKIFGVTRFLVSKIVTGIRWSWVGGPITKTGRIYKKKT